MHRWSDNLIIGDSKQVEYDAKKVDVSEREQSSFCLDKTWTFWTILVDREMERTSYSPVNAPSAAMVKQSETRRRIDPPQTSYQDGSRLRCQWQVSLRTKRRTIVVFQEGLPPFRKNEHPYQFLFILDQSEVIIAALCLCGNQNSNHL